LTALKADLVIAARTGLLALVSAACGFTQTRANATAYAALGVLGAVCGLDAVEFHLILLENFDQVTDLVDHAAYCGCVF
jgi:hypothetical protein